MQRILDHASSPGPRRRARSARRLAPPSAPARQRSPSCSCATRAGHRPGRRRATTVLAAARRAATRRPVARGRRHRRRRRRRRRAASSCTSPTINVLVATADGAAVRAAPTRAERRSCRRCSTTPRWRCAIRAIRRRSRSRRRRSPASASTLDATGLHRDPDAEDRRLRDRERRERLRARLLRPARVPRPEPAVLQADRWSACSSASTRPARCSAPSRTTPRATSPSTCRSTPSSGSSTTTAT